MDKSTELPESAIAVTTSDSKAYTLGLIRTEALARGEDPSDVEKYIEKLSQNWKPISGSGPWRVWEHLPKAQPIPGLIYMVPDNMDGPGIAKLFFPLLEEQILERSSAFAGMGWRLWYYGIIQPNLYLLIWGNTSEERYGWTSEVLLVQNIPGTIPTITRKLGAVAHTFGNSMRYLIQQAEGQLHRAQENVKFLESVVPIVRNFDITSPQDPQ